MKPRIYVPARLKANWPSIWMATLAATSMFTGCGEQDPSFTEREELPGSEDIIAGGIGTSDSVASADTAQAGDQSPVGSGGPVVPAGTNAGERFGGEISSWRPGDSLPPGYDGTNFDTSGLSLVSDSSVQQANSKVDVLWVVDSSGSMREEQTYLGQNFSSFITQMSQSNADFQIGVTSTDVCASETPSLIPLPSRYCPALDGSALTRLRGSLVGDLGKKVLNRFMPDLASRFLSYANVGIGGSSFEHGLTAAKMAIQKSVSGQNEGLVRGDAFLAVIVVSDEEDDGIGLGMTDKYTGKNYISLGQTSYRYTADDMIRDTLAVKGAGRFSVSTITGTRLPSGAMCSSPHSQPNEEGTQYISAANKTGGVVQSICDTNWSASLATIGQDIAAQSSQVLLSQKPYAPSIKVSINGLPSQNWTYNAGNNAIKFDVASLPPVGAKIDIQYYSIP